jgi:hypothetical protein
LSKEKKTAQHCLSILPAQNLKWTEVSEALIIAVRHQRISVSGFTLKIGIFADEVHELGWGVCSIDVDKSKLP